MRLLVYLLAMLPFAFMASKFWYGWISIAPYFLFQIAVQPWVMKGEWWPTLLRKRKRA